MSELIQRVLGRGLWRSATVVLAAAMCCSPSVSRALEYGRPISTGEFVEMCKTVVTQERAGGRAQSSPCIAYVVGFLESAGLLTYLEKTKPRYCLPVAVSPVEVVRRALKPVDSMDQKGRQQPAAFLLRQTLEAQFPCP